MPNVPIFDFDETQLDGWDPEFAAAALAEQPEHYVNHLAIARHLDGWSGRLAETHAYDDATRQNYAGFAEGLREVAAHLRQGDYLPKGGSFLEQQRHEDRTPREG